MPVNSTVSKIIYTGTGAVATYSFPFNVYLNTDLVLTEIAVDGTETLLVLTTDYTVSLSHVAPTPGTITLVAGNLAAGVQLVIQRVLPLTQEIEISDYSPTPAATWNEGLDRDRMVDQQLQEQVSRAVLQPIDATTPLSSDDLIADAAAASVAAVQPYATAAANSASAASGSASSASSSAGTATTQAGTATTQAGNAASSASAASASAIAAAAAAASIPAKATQAQAEAATSDAVYMTPLQVKNEVQKSGAVAIPAANIVGGVGTGTVTNVSSANGDIGVATGTTTPVLTLNSGTSAGQIVKLDGSAKLPPVDGSQLTGITAGAVETAWTDYSATSTIVGFGSFTTKQIFTKKIGKTVYVAYRLEGTSNASSITFTLPTASDGNCRTIVPAVAQTNSANYVGYAYLPASSNTVSLLPNQLGGGGSWTNGTSSIEGQFWYQTT